MARIRPTAPLAALVIAIAVLATQFVGLGREVIDPDESTFILMGADVARGNLPFVEQFDLKPPMIFLLIGGVLAAFGKSLIAVRLLGDLLLLGTALFTFSFARQIVSGWAALGGALIYVAFASMDLGQPTYSEFPALFFGMFALLMLAKAPVTPARAALAGAGLALAVLSRTNLYQLPVVFGLLLLVATLRKSPNVHPRAWLAFGFGGMVPVATLIAAYAIDGNLPILKLAMVDVALAYSQQTGPVAAVLENAQQFYVTATMEPLIVIPLALLAAAGLGLIVIARKAAGWSELVLLLAAATLLVSLVFSGAVYPHYWLQLAPVLGVLAALGLDLAARLPKGLGLAAIAGLLPIGSALAQRLPQAIQVVTHPEETAKRFEVAAAARHIQASGLSNPTIWPWRYQLIDWYLDAPQLSKAGVQPENIARPPIVGPLAKQHYVGADELGRVVSLMPDFIVTDARGKGLEWVKAASLGIEPWLTANYRLSAKFGDVLVYRRVSLPALGN